MSEPGEFNPGRALSGIRGSALFFLVIAAVCSCTFTLNDKSMDISDLIEKKKDLGKFINDNFKNIEYQVPFGPLPGDRVNLINKTESLTFCTMAVQQCWVKRIDTLYAFFILIKSSPEIEKHISKRYGKWETRAEISIQNDRLGGDLFSWSAGEVKIDVSSYFNILRDPRYEMCDLVLCRNMTYAQMLEMENAGK